MGFPFLGDFIIYISKWMVPWEPNSFAGLGYWGIGKKPFGWKNTPSKNT